MTEERSGSGRPLAVVTTGRKLREEDVARADRLAREWGLVYLPRRQRPVAALEEEAKGLGVPRGAVLVVEADGLTLHVEGVRFRYHPGMGLSRLRRVLRGEDDWMLRAMDLREGDAVLDATMGLASDLLVASHAVGQSGRAVGVESEGLIALVVKEGLSSYSDPDPRVVSAMRRIQVVRARYEEYLAALPARSFDVVYFDPMFRRPVEESDQIAPLRALANPAPLDPAALREALRVARRRVVVKDRKDGPHATGGFFDEVIGGAKSRIAFCIKRV
ncbi:MAG: hypothetical protein CW345_01080 [Firmicutes bacterium]|nr:hypothetical protein [Bacillota bacterium]MBO2520391.1 hypothetical protein [Bacillota bacterium]